MAQSTTASAGKEDICLALPLFADPGPESLYCRSSERGAALLTPLTLAPDVGTALQIDVALSEADEFRKTETSLNREH
jgi:hypothetical protein